MGKKNKNNKRRQRKRQKMELERSRGVSLMDQLSSPETPSDGSTFRKGAFQKPQHHLLDQPLLNGNYRPRSHNDVKSPPDAAEDARQASSDEPMADPEVRKRPKIDFVYPRSNGIASPFSFGQEGTRQNIDRNTKPSATASVNDDNKPTESCQPISYESIEHILSSKNRSKQRAGQENGYTQEAATTTIYEPESPGKLSGISVDDAVKDRYGCRPRANSTDGELNLPRRGLCDEHMVLASHKWTLDRNLLTSSSPKGFNNLGNTCFLNSTLQCLAYLPPFCQSLLAMPDQQYHNGNNRKVSQGKRITLLLKSLFQRVHRRDMNGKGTLSPQAIVKAIPTLGTIGSRNGYKFRPGRQEDAHEFLVHLLDAMHDGELREAGINQNASGWRDRLPVARLDETTFVHRIFGGYLRSQVKCTKCGYCSNTYDPFFDLALEISKKSCSSVAAAFVDFTRKETLDSDNRWQCSGCKKRVCATKQLTVFRPPLSLCVQMKRFTFGGLFKNGFGMGRSGSKITKRIDFPGEMKLPLSDKRFCPYALTGLVIHVGGSSDSGHYTAYVKKPGKSERSQWYHVDDSFVEAVSEREVLQQGDAYLLFYSRTEVKMDLPSPPPRGSMSAERATELGRVRAKARANSLTEGDGDKPKTATKDSRDQAQTQNFQPNQRSDNSPSKESESDDSSDSGSSSSSGSESDSDSNGKAAPAVTNDTAQPSAERDTALARNTNGGDQSSASSSSDDDGSSSSDSESSSSSEPSSEAKQPAKPAEGNTKSPSDSVSVKKSDPIEAQGGRGSGSLVKQEGQASTNRNDATTASNPGPAENKRTANKTVVVARGSGREKVSVMLGPRHHKPKKVWTPQSSGTTKIGQDFELLGNRSIDKWDDDTEDNPAVAAAKDANVAQGRAQMVRKMENESRSRKRKMHLDRWDASLDRGKAKKVKQKTDMTNPPVGMGSNAHPNTNAFQRILNSVQKMNRGRRKGHFRHDQSVKHKKHK